MILFITLITLCILLGYVFVKQSRKRITIPPGFKETPLERGLPIIGIILQAKKPLYHYLMTLSKKHGPLFRVRLGMRDILVLNDFQTIKKTLKDGGDNFSGRWLPKLFANVIRNSGVLFMSGELWAEQRSFILKILRDFGLGKSRSLEIVQNECLCLLEELEKSNGQSVDFSHFIPIYTANIISKFIMSKRYTREDPQFKLLESLISQNLRSQDFLQLFLLMFPALDYSDLFARFMMKISPKLKEFDKIHDGYLEEINKHIKELDFNSDGEDLMDRFLIMQKQLKDKNGTVGTFTDWQLVRNSLELFIAGYETTSTVLGWSFMFLSKHPEIQTRVHDEILDQIGDERLPTMNDKKCLNYTQAVMDEILRLSSVAPLAINHRTLDDAIVDEYFIPKDTLIFPNLFACHVDPMVWEKPLEFYPEHFLTGNNENGKYNPREELIPFGIGKRQCLGESLARMEYFIFLTSILQKFQVKFASEVSEIQYQNCLRGNEGIIRFSNIDNFIFLKRS